MLSDKGHLRPVPPAKKPDENPLTPKRKHTSATLRDMLFDEIRSLRKGDSEPDQAMAVAKLAQQIISSARVDIEYAQFQEKSREATVEPILLGSSPTEE